MAASTFHAPGQDLRLGDRLANAWAKLSGQPHICRPDYVCERFVRRSASGTEPAHTRLKLSRQRAAISPPPVSHRQNTGALCGWYAMGVLINRELVVGVVDRVVQHGPVKPDLDVLDSAEGPIQRERIANLGGHGVADSFFLTALQCVRPVWVSQRNSYCDARASFVGE